MLGTMTAHDLSVRVDELSSGPVVKLLGGLLLALLTWLSVQTYDAVKDHSGLLSRQDEHLSSIDRAVDEIKRTEAQQRADITEGKDAAIQLKQRLDDLLNPSPLHHP